MAAAMRSGASPSPSLRGPIPTFVAIRACALRVPSARPRMRSDSPWTMRPLLPLLVVLVGLRERAAVVVVLETVDAASADAGAGLAAAVGHAAFGALDHALGQVALVCSDVVVVDVAFAIARHGKLL